MRIPLDEQYILCSDKYCCWIMKIIPGENGPYELRVSGYYPDLEKLIDGYVAHELMGSEAQELQALGQEIKEMREAIKKWLKNIKK